MKWISIDKQKPRVAENILFTDGKEVYAGWLETYEPLEDLVFYNTLSSHDHWPENITHWMLFPFPPD